jgi:hypothetical protein
MVLDIPCLVGMLLATPSAGEPPPEDGYVYLVQGRRDPFVRPAAGTAGGSPACSGPGLASLLVDDTPLRGIVRTPDGAIVLLVGRDGVAQFGRVGDRLCDGTIEAIESDRVVYARKAPASGRALRVERRLWPSGDGSRP